MVALLHSIALVSFTIALGTGCRPAEKEFEDKRGANRFISLTGEASYLPYARDEVLDPEAFDDVLEGEPLPEGTEPDAEGSDAETDPATETEDTTEDTTDSDGKLTKICADLVGVSVKKVKIAGNQPSVSMRSGEAVAVKLTGNKAFLSLNLIGGRENGIEGICVFLAGNQAEAMITTNVNVGTLVYIGRGNRTKGQVTIGEGYQLQRSYVDLSGNQSQLSIDGDGQYFCPVPRQSGHDTSFTCQ